MVRKRSKFVLVGTPPPIVKTNITNISETDFYPKRFSSQLQPISEESSFSSPTHSPISPSISNQPSPKSQFEQALMEGASSSQHQGHINQAYETSPDDLPLQQEAPNKHVQRQTKQPQLLTRQVSFRPDFKINISQNESTYSKDSQKQKPETNEASQQSQQQQPPQSNVKPTEKNQKKERLPDWDLFETLPPPDEDETQKSEWVEVSIRWLKLFAYFFTFVMVLLFSVGSKTIILLMTSMTAVNHTVTICNQDSYYVVQPSMDHDKSYIAIYHKHTKARIAWVWSLYFATIAPYVFSFLRSVRIIYFKTFKVAKWQTLCTVFIAETLHCIGLSIFLFMLLPQMDVLKSAMMMNSVCFLPTFIRLWVETSAKPKTKNLQLMDAVSYDSSLFEEDNPFYSTAPKFDHLLLATNGFLSMGNFVLQCLTIGSWTFIGFHDELKYYYLIPVALILVSFEWWENFIVPDSMKASAMFLSQIRDDLNHGTRYFVYTFITLWKMLVIFTMMIMNEYVQNDPMTAKMMFTNFTDAFSAPTIPVIRDKRNYNSHYILDSDHNQLFVDAPLWPLWMLIIHVVLTYSAYGFAKFTCKVCFQAISFAIPVCLTVPVTISILWALSSVAFQDKCQLVETFQPFQYIFWNHGKMDMFDFTDWFNILLFIVWLVSFINQICSTLHIWKETSERLASTEQLFVSPGYNAVLIDQSLILNRRTLKLTLIALDDEDSDPNKFMDGPKESIDKPLVPPSTNEILCGLPRTTDNNLYEWTNYVEQVVPASLTKINAKDDWTKDWHQVCEMMGIEEDSIDAKPDPADDETIRIYICATMWHEDQNEMFQMLKAVMRLDYEQGLRRIAKKKFGDDVKKTIYEMEVNIYFDDAFEQGETDDEDDRTINRFVEQLIDTIGGSANQVFGKNLDLDPPTIVPTPYGGKLIWILPMGTNRLVAHIKDKNLIRHRKRWSQCMYMYYLLGYRLAARKDLNAERRKTIMNNTFILALDGDINFRPQAVDLVVDLMKKNNNLGAVCGRIHPIGTGPIVWYQKFEYAMGHWLQKATEHIIGCVLCSPGCFSLFRARALMDKSVMNKYTTKPSAAQHYVQYDQGEDRWLCTLLLQRGWRIEYCAASDSYTHAPEGFAEFYTQRRRWGPSTMANILDLLRDYKQTVKMNDNISNLYIIYQGLLMFGTIISPGTIFLMVVSAMNTVMGISTQMSFIYNMIPLLAFMFVCLKFKDNNIKITFAMILSVIYALLMLAVLVGTGIDMYTQGFFSPNSLFFSAMMSSFILAAIMHPQEFTCVLPLPIYMLFIPSMYMLLTIYSITNMNVVSWGTREVKSKLSAKELARQKEEENNKAKAAAKKKSMSFMNLSNVGNNKNGLFTCMCCSGGTETFDQDHKQLKGTIHEINDQVKEISMLIHKEFTPKINTTQENVSNESTIGHETNKISVNNQNQSEPNKNDSDGQNGGEQNVKNSTSAVENQNGDPVIPSREETMVKPLWVRNNPRLNQWPIRPIPPREEEFWKKMVAKYLYPLDEDLKEKERISQELADLRNKFVFAFAFLNIIFIIFVFMLQLHKDVFGINIPVGRNGTIDEYIEEEDRHESRDNIIYTRMDPINLILVLFFGAILFIQCIGMIIHRFGTLAHLLAYTEIREKKRKIDYSKFVAELINEKIKRSYGNRRRRRSRRIRKDQLNMASNRISGMNFNMSGQTNETTAEGGEFPDSMEVEPDYDQNDDDVGLYDSFENSAIQSDQIKPSQYAEVFEKELENLKTDQSQIKKMPKIMRKNTIRAMRRHEQHQQEQAKLLQRRESMYSINSVPTSEYTISNASQTRQHKELFQTLSIQSSSTIIDEENLHRKQIRQQRQSLGSTFIDQPHTSITMQPLTNNWSLEPSALQSSSKQESTNCL